MNKFLNFFFFCWCFFFFFGLTFVLERVFHPFFVARFKIDERRPSLWRNFKIKFFLQQTPKVDQRKLLRRKPSFFPSFFKKLGACYCLVTVGQKQTQLVLDVNPGCGSKIKRQCLKTKKKEVLQKLFFFFISLHFVCFLLTCKMWISKLFQKRKLLPKMPLLFLQPKKRVCGTILKGMNFAWASPWIQKFLSRDWRSDLLKKKVLKRGKNSFQFRGTPL